MWAFVTILPSGGFSPLDKGSPLPPCIAEQSSKSPDLASFGAKIVLNTEVLLLQNEGDFILILFVCIRFSYIMTEFTKVILI